jgi:hypothetical protein
LPTSFEIQEPAGALTGGLNPSQQQKCKADGELETSPAQKKKKARNAKPCAEFKLAKGEDYKWFSAEKESRPKFRNGNCKMCPKFHIKEVCHTNCIDAETHLPESKIKDKEKAEYKEWMDSVRAKHA